jgi:hypothetical protein
MIGVCLEASLFIPAFIYALYDEGRAGLYLLVMLHIPFSLIGIWIGFNLMLLTDSELLFLFAVYAITIIGQFLFWSTVAFILQKGFQKIRSILKTSSGAS